MFRIGVAAWLSVKARQLSPLCFLLFLVFHVSLPFFLLDLPIARFYPATLYLFVRQLNNDVIVVETHY